MFLWGPPLDVIEKVAALAESGLWENFVCVCEKCFLNLVSVTGSAVSEILF